MSTESFDVSAAGVRTIKKDPSAVLDYTFDWTAWLDLVSDTIATRVITPDAGITVDLSVILSGSKKVTVWLSGGTAGNTYAIACRITTASNPVRTDERTFYVKVQER